MRRRFASRCPHSAAPPVSPSLTERIFLAAMHIERPAKTKSELKVSSLKSNEASLTYNAAKRRCKLSTHLRGRDQVSYWMDRQIIAIAASALRSAAGRPLRVLPSACCFTNMDIFTPIRNIGEPKRRNEENRQGD
jgi:hypothetical protein